MKPPKYKYVLATFDDSPKDYLEAVFKRFGIQGTRASAIFNRYALEVPTEKVNYIIEQLKSQGLLKNHYFEEPRRRLSA